MLRRLSRLLVSIASLALFCWAQPPKGGDLTKEPTLYVIPYAHLDTQWGWDYPTTINRHIPNTMRLNFELFEKYPHYIFNFSGANRYQMMKEYYPADYQKVKKYVAAGRWFPSGSSWEENDVNSPNAESVIRQVLYGKQWFRREFGKTSAEYMLPDCFGFPASLPSILSHVGIKGFSTQKLNAVWQPAPKVGGPDSPEKTPEGIPFNVGVWEGLDGKTVMAALNPGGYGDNVTYDLSKSPAPPPPPDPNNPQQRRPRRDEDWPARVKMNGDLTGVYADYHYYGTGDIGGSPQEASIAFMEAIVTKGKISLPPPRQFGGQGQPQAPPPPPAPPIQVGDGPLRVIQSDSDQIFVDIKPEMTSKLPRYKGDLELINHSAGSITSQGYMKIWNRRNELLADAAEKASVAAQMLGGRAYPQERINRAWELVMSAQFHDIIPGTSIPKAYEYSWNDEVVAMNQFAGVVTSATEAVASALNTKTKGQAIVVYNPLAIAREDVVEAGVKFASTPKAVRVTGPDGKDVPAQLSGGKVLFVAKVPSAGYAVYDVRPAAAPAPSALKVTESSLENARYAVKIDKNGDVSGIYDKLLAKELLSSPIRLGFTYDDPRMFPAWNMEWGQVSAPQRTIVGGPAQIRVVENGPARVAVEISRQAEDSKFVQTIRLSAGDGGNRVEIRHAMDWMGKAANLKVAFPFTASNENATYNWDIGTIQRPTRYDRQFEVASHQWIDLTDKSGAFGVTILSDCKNASDKVDDRTIRLTLVRSPGSSGGDPHQATQDWGHHDLVYGLAGHKGDFREAQTDWQAHRLNDPLMAFSSARHAGALGKTFSLMSVNNSRIRVLAVKKAEQSGEVVVRMVELDGKPAANVQVSFAAPITAAREINGAEEPVGAATVQNGKLATAFTAFQPRTFAVKLGAAAVKVASLKSQPVSLTYDAVVSSNDAAAVTGGFDGKGGALPAEMLPAEVAFGDVQFKLGPAGTGAPNAVTAKGQTINLPAGKLSRVYVLAASAEGDQKATFKAGAKAVDLIVENWTGFVGQWDNRVLEQKSVPAPPDPNRPAQPNAKPRMIRTSEYKSKIPGYIKRADIAWFASHHHSAEGKNQAYQYSYLFAYPIDVPAGAKTLTLPDNDKIRILAISVVDEGSVVTAAAPLYDVIEKPDTPATLAAR
jgi:alpha-mannosidase